MKLKVLVFFMCLGISSAAAQPAAKAKQSSSKAKRVAKQSKKQLSKRPDRANAAGRQALRQVVRQRAYKRTPKRAETTLHYSTNGKALLKAVKASGKAIVLGKIGEPGREFNLFLNKKGKLTYGVGHGELAHFTAKTSVRHAVDFASVHRMLRAAVSKLQNGSLKYVVLVREH